MTDLTTSKALLHQLYDAEYGDLREVWARYVAISACSLLFYIYTGSDSVIVWMGGNIVVQAIQYTFLKTRGASPSHRDVIIGNAIYFVVLAWFLWLPTQVILEEDVVLRITAATAYATTLLFLVRRNDTDLAVVIGICVIVAASILFLMLGVAKTSSAPIVILGITICGLFFLGSFCMTILANRHRTLLNERAAKRMLESQRIETVGRLASGVAHDFNNVLTAIMGNLELLEVGPEKERPEFLARAKVASQQAEALVERLLSYSRKTPNQHPEVVNVSEQAEAFALSFDRWLGSRAGIRVISSSEPLYACVCAQRFSVALMNLAINARDAMSAVGTITLKTDRDSIFTKTLMLANQELSPGDYVRVQVTDEGSGMSPDMLRRIAEPFFTTKPEGQGTGLGLYMVCEFAAETGGALSVASSPQGTTMTLWLPETDGSQAQRLTAQPVLAG